MNQRFILNELTGRYGVRGELTVDEILYEARNLAIARLSTKSQPIQNPSEAKEYLSSCLLGLEYEVFCGLFLDNRHRVLAFRRLFRGTIDGCAVYSREVVKVALQLNAAAVIFAHNHPSGDPTPSDADRRITQRLKDALALVDVRVLDHFVVGIGKIMSVS